MGNLLDEIRLLIRSFQYFDGSFIGRVMDGNDDAATSNQFYRVPTRGLTGPKAAKALALRRLFRFISSAGWRDLILGKKPETDATESFRDAFWRFV